MAKGRRKKNKKVDHPTLFALDGSIKHYPDGSMLELHSQVTAEEWEEMIRDTVCYLAYLNCLKKLCPEMQEPWTEEDEWFRLQMEVATSRMRNIDPLLLAKFDLTEITNGYYAKMQAGAESFVQLKQQIQQEKRAMYAAKYDLLGGDSMQVSNL